MDNMTKQEFELSEFVERGNASEPNNYRVRVRKIKEFIKLIRGEIIRECKGTKANSYNLNQRVSKLAGPKF